MPREGIEVEALTHECREPIDRAAEIRGRRSPRRSGPPVRSSARRAQRRDDLSHQAAGGTLANHDPLATREHDLNDAGGGPVHDALKEFERL
jgi:hypothetical protein